MPLDENTGAGCLLELASMWKKGTVEFVSIAVVWGDRRFSWLLGGERREWYPSGSCERDPGCFRLLSVGGHLPALWVTLQELCRTSSPQQLPETPAII